MEERLVTISNSAGIHCRPSSVILNTIKNDFPHTRFMIENTDGSITEINGILDLIALGLQYGEVVKLRTEGENAAAAADQVAELLSFPFDFPRQ